MAIPVKLGKYEVMDEISRGNMGKVFHGYDPYGKRDVAIKVAHEAALAESSSGHNRQKLFFNEAHIAGDLDHSNIVKIHDAGIDQGHCYIVMELIAGGKTLKEYSRPGKLLPMKKVVEIIYKCSMALDYAHKKGVTHRDIKPSNILVKENMDVLIGDFGIAHTLQPDAAHTQIAGLMGSPQYMSPEQIKEEEIDHRTDLFSLGLILYEMLTGKHPFKSNNFSQLVNKILHDDIPPLKKLRPEFPEILTTIVNKATRKNRQERYESGLEFASALNNAFQFLTGIREDVLDKEKFQSMKNLVFFRGFPDTEIWEIVHSCNWQNYESNHNIIGEYEIDDCFYIIVKGRVSVEKGGKSFSELSAGNCFGEMGYLAKIHRTATVRTLEETTLLKLNSTIMSQISLSCQVRFLKVFLRTLIYRLSVTTQHSMKKSEQSSTD